MLEHKKVKSWFKSVSAFANMDGDSLFYGVNDDISTTFYNLNWGENRKIPVKEVVNRINSTLEKYTVNEECSMKKYIVNEKNSVKTFGDLQNLR